MSAIAGPAPAVTTTQLWSSFLRAEWIKLTTVRSTLYTLAAAAVAAIGIGAISCQRMVAELSGTDAFRRLVLLHGFDASARSLIGNILAQLAVGALGALIVTSEYGTGMIRASLTAMPQRQGWIAAKLAVFGAVALVVGQALTFASFGVGQAVLSIAHAGLSLSDPQALRTVVATGIYVSLVGLLGVGFGLIIRHTAGAITTLIGTLFVLPAIVTALSQPLQGQVMRFLPSSIGEQAASIDRLHDHFAPWAGIGLMVGYVAVVVAIGCVLLQRRDA
ncbi:MAG TPA: hypothetical protein VG708_06130 [Mycobacteriales bacterium]|nr:hypothetical protein [Mycobacteriales bacterium]